LLLGGLCFLLQRFLVPPPWRWVSWVLLLAVLLCEGTFLWLPGGGTFHLSEVLTLLFVDLLAWRPERLLPHLVALWQESLWLAPLQACLLWLFIPAGAGPRLLAHSQAQSAREERARARANRLVEQAMPEEAGGEVVLGVALAGDLPWKQDRWCICPRARFGEPILVFGEPGSGKTETVLRLAYGAAKVHRRQVLYVDAKGDPRTAVKFVACMLAAGVAPGRIKAFPYASYDGWRGDDRALLNRLISVHTFTEEYYRDLAISVLDLALRASTTPVRSSAVLLRRLYRETLEASYAARREARDVEEITTTEVKGVRHRFQAFFKPLAGCLDGSWAFDDVDAAYILIPGLSLRQETAALGRFFVEELAHYIAERKPTDREVLVVLDELSALNMTMGAEINPANLFERVRAFGAGVVGTSQSPGAVGFYADRVLDASPLRIVHTFADPQGLVSRAGASPEIEATEQVRGDEATGAGTMRVKENFTIHPDQVRRLPRGFAFVSYGGRGREVRVGAVTVPDEIFEAAKQLLLDLGASQTQPAPRRGTP